MCTTCMQVPVETKRALDALELESQAAVTHHVGAGCELRSSARATCALNQKAISPALGFSAL